MADFTFGPFIALDPTQQPRVAQSASGKVYAKDDLAHETPLPMRDLNGVTMTEAVADSAGLVQGITVADNAEVAWVSGNYVVPLRSFGGVLDQATLAAASAADSADSANSAAASASQSRVPVGGTSGQVLAKASNTDNDVAWINPPAGGGGGGGALVLGSTDPVPVGTPAMTAIFRLETEIPTPDEVSMLTGGGNVTSVYGSLTTTQTVAAPANTEVGDVLIAIGWSQSPSAPWDWAVPAGWTSQFESNEGRHFLVATFPVADQAALDAVTAGTHLFEVTGDTSNSRNGAMIFRVTGANLTTPVVGASSWAQGTAEQKTFPAFSASSPAAAQLLVSTANLSAGVAEHPVIAHAAGYQAVNTAVAYGTTGDPLPESTGTAVLYRISGLEVPERSETYTPTWSAGVWGLHLAIAGA